MSIRSFVLKTVYFFSIMGHIRKEGGKNTVGDLHGDKTLELSLTNQSGEVRSAGLKHSFSYNVSLDPAAMKGLGYLNFVIKSEGSENGLRVRVSLVADLTYEAGDERKYIHKESFRQVFPYLRMIITNLCSCAGIGGMIIPNLRIKDEQIKDL